MAGDAVDAGAARRFSPIPRRPVWPIHHGSEGPRVDSQRPSGSRACEWRPRYSGDLPESAPSTASIADEATRDAIAPRYRAERARAPRANAATCGPTRSKQPISAPQLRTGACASERAELLAQGEVLEHQFVMSAAGHRQRSAKYKDHLQHPSILSFYEQRSNDYPPVLILAKDRRKRRRRIIGHHGTE
jgi:hypothetical protein